MPEKIPDSIKKAIRESGDNPRDYEYKRRAYPEGAILGAGAGTGIGLARQLGNLKGKALLKYLLKSGAIGAGVGGAIGSTGKAYGPKEK